MADVFTTPGELDRLISLQALSTTRDVIEGDLIPGWTTVYSGVWAKLTERDVSAGSAAGQQTASRSITLRIRWRADVLATWRALLGTRVLQITGTLEVGRHQYLDLLCKEVTSG